MWNAQSRCQNRNPALALARIELTSPQIKVKIDSRQQRERERERKKESYRVVDPMATSCSTAVTGHVAKHSWLYATEIRWSAPSLMILPH